jgi:hypothetical protein
VIIAQTNKRKVQGTRFNMNQYQMMQTDTLQQAPYAQQETHQTTYMPQMPTLPQESNYAMETSHAATSRAEESIDSDDNDDRLSWQAVNARGNKRTCPRTTKVPTMKKNKLQETITHLR